MILVEVTLEQIFLVKKIRLKGSEELKIHAAHLQVHAARDGGLVELAVAGEILPPGLVVGGVVAVVDGVRPSAGHVAIVSVGGRGPEAVAIRIDPPGVGDGNMAEEQDGGDVGGVGVVFRLDDGLDVGRGIGAGDIVTQDSPTVADEIALEAIHWRRNRQRGAGACRDFGRGVIGCRIRCSRRS